ncbi:MAG: hypothetical protein ACOC90_00090, partial [Bacteroidota bacterium]
MKKRNIILIVLTLGCISLACSAGKTERPDWFWNPSMDGQIGGIGASGPHVRGINAQRQLAISRAIDEIARQMEVEVSNVVKMLQKGNQDKVNTTRHSY